MLKLFFKIPDTLETILSYTDSLKNSDKIFNYIQTDTWKQKLSFYKSDDIVLPLIFYFDDFEPNNPLGPKSNKRSLWLCLHRTIFLIRIKLVRIKHRAYIWNRFYSESSIFIYVEMDVENNIAVLFSTLFGFLKIQQEYRKKHLWQLFNHKRHELKRKLQRLCLQQRQELLMKWFQINNSKPLQLTMEGIRYQRIWQLQRSPDFTKKS